MSGVVFPSPGSLTPMLHEQSWQIMIELMLRYWGKTPTGEMRSEIPESTFAEAVRKITFGVDPIKLLKDVQKMARRSGWFIVHNPDLHVITAISIIPEEMTKPRTMKNIIESTDWEIVEEAADGEELRIRKKKRAAPSPVGSSPSSAKKAASSPE